jgi:hypothetical protein
MSVCHFIIGFLVLKVKFLQSKYVQSSIRSNFYLSNRFLKYEGI